MGNLREIELHTRIIEIEEGKQENVAGSVVWDAAFCLIKYLDHSKRESDTPLFKI